MTRGLDRQQIGVSDTMLKTYGDVVFRLSNNLQHRKGDPIREGLLEEVMRQRPALGMSDAQIATYVGLSENQVTYIRNHEEVRRMRTNNFQRLLNLGGGRRFRVDQFVPHEEQFRFREDAMELRSAMHFDPECARSYIERGWWTNETLRGWLEQHTRELPKQNAILSSDCVMTYADLAIAVDHLAGALLRLGVRKGDVVAVHLPNCPEYLISYLAIAQIGAVMTTAYTPHRAGEFMTFLGHSRARAVICLSDADRFAPAEMLMKLKPKLPALHHVIALGNPIPGAESYQALVGAGESIKNFADSFPVAADPLVLLYASSSMASPKGVLHNYHTVLSNARLSASEYKIDADDILLSAGPYGHFLGLCSLTLAACVGATNMMLPSFTPAGLAQIIESFRPTVLFADPTHIAACLDTGLFDQHDISSLKLAILGGTNVPYDLARDFDAKLVNGETYQLWGMTEMQTGLYAQAGDTDTLEVVATATAARPSLGTEVRIVDDNGSPTPNGKEGELQARGCRVFSGYLRNDNANALAFTPDGWFRSGDLAVSDAAGNVYITYQSTH